MEAAVKGFSETVKSERVGKWMPKIERRLRVAKLIADIVIAIAAFLLGRCSSLLF